MDSRENVKTRRIEANVKGKIIEFDEYYMIDPATGEEVFDRNIEIENDARLYDIYKKCRNDKRPNKIIWSNQFILLL